MVRLALKSQIFGGLKRTENKNIHLPKNKNVERLTFLQNTNGKFWLYIINFKFWIALNQLFAIKSQMLQNPHLLIQY